MYLLDTNVVSELRRPRPAESVVAWLRGQRDQNLFLSTATLGELQAGVELVRDQDPDKARQIEAWVDVVASTHNVLPLDGPIMRTWGRLVHRRSNTLLEDALIAATAVVHGLTVVTRNVRHFRPFDVPVLDPFRRT